MEAAVGATTVTALLLLPVLPSLFIKTNYDDDDDEDVVNCQFGHLPVFTVSSDGRWHSVMQKPSIGVSLKMR